MILITRFSLTALLLLFSAAANRSEISFPKDHGSHPEAAVEWWYYTGHLRDGGGLEYGFELTFFRVGELHLAHFAWTDVARKRFTYEEKSHLGLPGIAETEAGGLAVTNEDWSARETGGVHRLHASGRGWEFDLDLSPSKPPTLHGEGGLSRKGPGGKEFSHYVSITRLAVSGRTLRDGRRATLFGTAWFDHEWGPGVLPQGAAGWDWFALQLDDGSDLMLYRMRGPDGGATPYSAGTFVPKTGPPTHLSWRDLRLRTLREWVSPRSGARYPAGWELAVDPLGLEVSIDPLLSDQELVTGKSTGVTYWEGACRVSGRRQGRPAAGRAYAELTGYTRTRDVPGLLGGVPALTAPPSSSASTSPSAWSPAR